MTEERTARLEGAYEQVNERLNDLNRAMSELRSDMNSRFNQQLGIIGAAWATLMAAILALLFTNFV